MTAELIAPREEIVAKLHDLWLARQAKNEATKVDSQITEAVKQWLGLEGEDEVVDGEHGIRAYIRETRTTNWDISTADDSCILYLAREGLLDVKTKAFDERRKNKPAVQLDVAMNYRHEGENYQLRVEKKD